MKELLNNILGENYCNISRITVNGITWYKAKDVCAAIGIKNTSLAVNGNIRIGYFGVDQQDIYQDNQQPRAPLYISEAGIYKLILKSRKPAANRVKSILSTSILPDIMQQTAISNA